MLAGRPQLSHSSGSQKALLGALSLFRQEMSADSGLWDAVAGWLTMQGGGRECAEHSWSQVCGPLGRQSRWEVQPLGRKITL